MKITKLLSLLFLSLVFVSNGCNEDENTDIEQNCDAPRCYVSKTTQVHDNGAEFEGIWQYKTVNGEKLLEKNIYTSRAIEHIYDDKNRYLGNKEFTTENNQSILDNVTSIEYDNQGKISLVRQLFYELQGTVEGSEDRYEFEYDAQGRQKEVKKYYNGEYGGKDVFEKYNQDNQLILRYTYDENDNLTYTYTLEYEDCNPMTGKKFVSKNLLQVYQAPFFTDCNSGCSMTKESYQSQSRTEVYTQEYNEQGLLKSRTLLRENGDIAFTIYFEYQCD